MTLRRVSLKLEPRVVDYYARMFEKGMTAEEKALYANMTDLAKATRMLEGSAIIECNNWERQMGWRQSHAEPYSTVESRKNTGAVV